MCPSRGPSLVLEPHPHSPTLPSPTPTPTGLSTLLPVCLVLGSPLGPPQAPPICLLHPMKRLPSATHTHTA